MALDGITAFAIVSELKTALLGGRIDKIHQPLADEIRMSVRGNGAPKKLLLSANSGHPRIHLTEGSRENPMSAPALDRKSTRLNSSHLRSSSMPSSA